MLDHVLAREAFRARVLSLVVATTGIVNDLYTTADGYRRSTGSFLTDGFTDGMEITGVGFNPANNAAGVGKMIEGKVLTGFLPIRGGLTAQPAAAGRTLTASLPQDRRWHGTQTPATTAPATRPHILEQWVPGAVEDDGGIVDSGLYVITWNALANKGVATSLRQMTELRNHFPPGLRFVIGTDRVRVSGKPSASFTQPITLDNGYESSTLRVAWRVMGNNVAA